MKNKGFVMLAWIATLAAFLIPVVLIAATNPHKPLYEKREAVSPLVFEEESSPTADQNVDAAGEKQEETTADEEPDGEQPVFEKATKEQLALYESLGTECSCETESGIRMSLIATDRACGSSYYTLLKQDGDEYYVNQNPFDNTGGQALFITFEDDKLGFAALSYNGGDSGMLFRTEDGGEHFTYIPDPIEPQIELSDSESYCPFVIPESILKEDGKLVLLMRQGQNGDYAGAEGYCAGEYESTDDGLTWHFVKEIPVGLDDEL